MTFEPVEPGSVSGNVRVMSHGWAPGLGPVVDASERFLRVWDPDATTPEGSRFDRWYGPLAEAMLEHDPTSTVLGYTWIDGSATSTSKARGARSQLRTSAAGHSLALALSEALSGGRSRIHLIGHSHGSKVVTVAATLLAEPPAQVTLFDSPENLLPLVGGALNDLSSYLRALPIGPGDDETFVDNYASRYGIRYGRDPGLGDVVDVTLNPGRFPIDDTTNEHSYAWLWYIESARSTSRGVGFAWSRLNAHPHDPTARQLRHPDDGNGADALRLEPTSSVKRGRRLATTVRERTSAGTRGVIKSDRPVRRGFYWRRSGDQVASINLRWLEGPSDASVTLLLSGAEVWRSSRSWSDVDTRRGAIPVASVRSGIGVYEIRLDSTGPAAVEIAPGTVRGIPVPVLVEYRSWLRPLAAVLLATSAAVLTTLLRRLTRRA